MHDLYFDAAVVVARERHARLLQDSQLIRARRRRRRRPVTPPMPGPGPAAA